MENQETVFNLYFALVERHVRCQLVFNPVSKSIDISVPDAKACIVFNKGKNPEVTPEALFNKNDLFTVTLPYGDGDITIHIGNSSDYNIDPAADRLVKMLTTRRPDHFDGHHFALGLVPN